jgi:hypothetical protein
MLEDLELHLIASFYGACDQQERFDAKVARSLARIVRGETNGIARGRAHEARELLKEIVNAA